MKRGGRTSIREGLCCAIFARRVQIVGEKIPRLLFLRCSSSRTDHSSSTRVLLPGENLIAHENYKGKKRNCTTSMSLYCQLKYLEGESKQCREQKSRYLIFPSISCCFQITNCFNIIRIIIDIWSDVVIRVLNILMTFTENTWQNWYFPWKWIILHASNVCQTSISPIKIFFPNFFYTYNIYNKM